MATVARLLAPFAEGETDISLRAAGGGEAVDA
jgi:hypothetical protein